MQPSFQVSTPRLEAKALWGGVLSVPRVSTVPLWLFPPTRDSKSEGRKRSTPSSLWFQFMSPPGVQFHNMVLMILGCGFIFLSAPHIGVRSNLQPPQYRFAQNGRRLSLLWLALSSVLSHYGRQCDIDPLSGDHRSKEVGYTVQSGDAFYTSRKCLER